MITKLLKNPFERIAGWQALGLGLAVLTLTAVFGKINGIYFDGVLDVHTSSGIQTQTWAQAFVMQAVDWLSAVVCMGLAGIIFAKARLRLVDIAGTMALARLPYLLLAIVSFLPVAPANLTDVPRMIVFGLLWVAAAIWMVVLMYGGYSVSCNLKGARAVWSFTGALVISEAVSKLVFIFLLSGLFNSTASVAAADANFTIPEGQTIQQTAEKVMTAFEKEDFNTIALYFDDNMRKAITPTKLTEIWSGLHIQLGKYVKADTDVEATEHEGFRILLIPCEFKRGSVNFQLTFDSSGRIAGLYLRGM